MDELEVFIGAPYGNYPTADLPSVGDDFEGMYEEARAELERRGGILNRLLTILGVDEFWLHDAESSSVRPLRGPRTGPLMQKLARLLISDIAALRVHVHGLLGSSCSFLDMLESAIVGGWELRVAFRRDDLAVFRRSGARREPVPKPLWFESADRVSPYGHLDLKNGQSIQELNEEFCARTTHLLRERSHLQCLLFDGGINGMVYRYFRCEEWLQDVLDGPSEQLTYWEHGAEFENNLMTDASHPEERRLILGTVLDSSRPGWEATLLPPNEVWFRAGHSVVGANHMEDAKLFELFMARIEKGEQRCQTRAEWKKALRVGVHRRRDAELVERIRESTPGAMAMLKDEGLTEFGVLGDLGQFAHDLPYEERSDSGRDQTA